MILGISILLFIGISIFTLASSSLSKLPDFTHYRSNRDSWYIDYDSSDDD